jgi:hypothetical protein
VKFSPTKLAHRFPHCVEESVACILHQMPAIGDLHRVGQRPLRRQGISPASIPSDDGDLRLADQPCLGQVLEDEGGSYALALAAYNAGGGRVVQWIAAHGDPRTGGADLVDWIERIPFDETRDYVERVSENLGVYRQRLADEPPTPPPMSLLLARE